MILRNCRFMVTQNSKREILENVDISVNDGIITEIGKNLSGDDVVDASSKIVIPGLINSHTHSPMSLFRGISDDKSLHPWLNDSIMPNEKKLNNEMVYYGSLLSMIEKISTGTTTFVDMYSYTDTIIKAVNKTGMRAFISSGLKDSGDDASVDSEINRKKGILSKIRENGNGLIKPVLSLHWSLTCSDELISKTASLDGSLPLFMHLSENETEVKENMKMFGKRPIERIGDIGVLNESFVAVHAVHLSGKEIGMIKEAGASVVHNPSANMKLADGVSPVSQLLKRGICVSLGTDSSASNDNLNMFEEMKIASLLQKVSSMDAGAMKSQETLDMATVNASHVCKDTSIGSLEVGKKADIVFIDKNNLSLNPALNSNNILSNLLYAFNGSVSDVMINGEFVMKNGDITTVDKNEIFEKIREFSI